MRAGAKFIVLIFYFSLAVHSLIPRLTGAAVVSAFENPDSQTARTSPPCSDKPPQFPLPPPSSMSPDEFHCLLLAFLQSQEYEKLNWAVDKGVRDTGPFVNNSVYGYFGVHPAVRIYYSPGVIEWLKHERKGNIADGEMIVKEMYPGPAVQWQGQQLTPNLWTVMVKDSKGSKDGWFWGQFWIADPPMPKPSDSYDPPFPVLNEGFGLPCLRCHSSAETESTFASSENIKGFPGQPLSYYIDNSWRTTPPAASSAPGSVVTSSTNTLGNLTAAHGLALKAFQQGDPSHRIRKGTRGPGFFNSSKLSMPAPNLTPFKLTSPESSIGTFQLPPETFDHIVAAPKGAEEFITSDSCMVCHSANPWYGLKNIMVLQPGTSNPVNVSPYGEWRWSPMGLAGRDPVFYSQLDSELSYLKGDEKKQAQVVNTCFSCHGVMGKRQLDCDKNPGSPCSEVRQDELDFDLNYIYSTDTKDPYFKYGALARDGVSCAACHRTVEDKPAGIVDPLIYFLEHTITGRFKTGPSDEIYGPFANKPLATFPMKSALGIEPKMSALTETPPKKPYIQDSRMCGSCHTIDLPVMDRQPAGHNLEQVTYLEWLNSQYRTEFSPGPNAKSCQDCHMPGSYVNSQNNVSVPLIQSAFADVQDNTYPASSHLAKYEDVTPTFRNTGFARHQFQGLNVFLLEMFNQFTTSSNGGDPANVILGVRINDYQSTMQNDLANAISNYVQVAQNDTATVSISNQQLTNTSFKADVTVTNKTGHRFPSGVGFRRAFIEFDVVDNSVIDPTTGQAKIVWSSGRTNENGFIVDNNGNILETEYIGTGKNPGGPYQHHHSTGNPITLSTQVQIYEELTKNSDGNFTTSFIRRDREVKENRLLPVGWAFKGPAPFSLGGRFLESTRPDKEALADPNFTNGKGTSVVRYEIPLNSLPKGTDPQYLSVQAILYYQSIPPYYLMQRFEQAKAPYTTSTQRLYYMVSRLNLSNTSIQNWKLQIASAKAGL
jgi:Cytochrome P460